MSTRELIVEVMPELLPYLDDELIEKVYHSAIQKNTVHMEFAKTPPANDMAMADYMVKTNLLSEMNLSINSVLNKIKSVDVNRHVLIPLKPYAEYYSTASPIDEVILPAEFEPIKTVLIAWPIYYPYNWIQHANFIKAITEAHADVHIVLPNKFWQKGVEVFLSINEVPLDRVRFIHTPIDNVWIRDYGPTAVYQKSTGKTCLIANQYLPNGEPFHKKDVEVPIEIGRYYGFPVYRLPIIIEGGNIISDGKGTSIMFDSVLKRNPDITEEMLEKILKDYYGIHRLILLECLSGEITGHVDMVVRFVDADTIMIAESDPGYKWHEDFEKIAIKLSALTSATGNRYRIIRVPVADNNNDSLNFWSYINSLIVNDTVIVPIFGVSQDSKSLEIYRKAMPHHKIKAINMRNYQVGSLHCQSKEIPHSPFGKDK
jgi:agmatine deiminase